MTDSNILVGLPIEPPHSMVGFGLQFGGNIAEVRYCVTDSVISVTSDAKGKFVINFTMPSCWLNRLIDALEANDLEYAGYELAESPERFATRLDEHGEAVGPPVHDSVIHYFTIKGVFPNRIQTLKADTDDIHYVPAQRQNKK